jgi:hypothetical protein
LEGGDSGLCEVTSQNLSVQAGGKDKNNNSRPPEALPSVRNKLNMSNGMSREYEGKYEIVTIEPNKRNKSQSALTAQKFWGAWSLLLLSSKP